uniref:Nucleotide-diphospho-sugar transferase domain-containing protein n=1 Tax=Compsopogon caeruleus TaxID=31354 RepID=A0A7S1XDJ5_9RHOD|mmetsp:Transcript_15823/g.31761  ORF Transcript_15823/g.31761 Transcript_15823/m.31761 type:complete len:418 (+) Transcript_15823:81-1334(+)
MQNDHFSTGRERKFVPPRDAARFAASRRVGILLASFSFLVCWSFWFLGYGAPRVPFSEMDGEDRWTMFMNLLRVDRALQDAVGHDVPRKPLSEVNSEDRLTPFKNQLRVDRALQNVVAQIVSSYTLERAKGQGLGRKSVHSRAILSAASDVEHMERYSTFSLVKACYALHHEEIFLLRLFSLPQHPSMRESHFLKIPTVLETLKSFDVVMWMDTDTLFMRFDHNVFDSIENNTAGFILADHSAQINNGVFFVRAGEWTNRFLNRWVEPDKSTGFMWCWQDNGSMYAAFAEELCREAGHSPCLAFDSILRQHNCLIDHVLNKQLEDLSKPYGHREQIGGICLLPQHINENRINRHYFNGTWPHMLWTTEDYYREGDIVMHTKFLRDEDRVIEQAIGIVKNEIWALIVEKALEGGWYHP